MEQIRVVGKFTWIPPDQRPSRFPGPLPPRKPELRKPLYALIPDKHELYFVNFSNDTLTEVATTAGGFENIGEDEDLLPLRGPAYRYESVKPGEAVKVEEYTQWDSDSVLQVTIAVSHSSLGKKVFRSGKKGGIDHDVVLLWDNGDIGKDAYLVR